MKNTLEYSLVIPVYRSGAWLDELAQRIDTVMKNEKIDSFETIMVNDCSPDTITWPAILRNAKKYPWLKGYNLLYNVGQFKAMMCGMQHAKGQMILNMDDDLQHLPEELPKLIQAMKDAPDVLCVMGKYETRSHSFFRNWGSKLFRNILNRLYEKPTDIHTTSFRILRRELVTAILNYRTSKPQLGPLIVSLTKKIKNVSVQHAPRVQGKSGYGLGKLISNTFDSIIHGSTAPLRAISMTGLMCSVASVILGCYYFIKWLSGQTGVAGYTSQILLIIFFGGMTLASVGIVGEYVARIIAEVTGPDRFFIKETTENDHV